LTRPLAIRVVAFLDSGSFSIYRFHKDNQVICEKQMSHKGQFMAILIPFRFPRAFSLRRRIYKTSKPRMNNVEKGYSTYLSPMAKEKIPKGCS
jgi:hypothetical protein